MNKILIVGQTPPPFHGQAIAIQEILNACKEFKEVRNVRMSFSHKISDIGKFQIKKILELFTVVGKIWWYKIYWGCNIIYFPPTGGVSKIPLYRDFFVLITTRFLFKKTIFHFHAGGINEIYDRLNLFEKKMFCLAYKYPDISVIMSREGIKDTESVCSKKIKIIPYGLKDSFENVSKLHHYNIRKNNKKITILFVGIVRKTKGVKVLLEAVSVLVNSGLCITLNIIGGLESEDFDIELRKFIADNSLEEVVNLLGIKIGTEKDFMFRQADIFCFPTFYECENFPNVLMEAMMYSLPIVTTEWRGNCTLVQNNVNGFLCPIQSVSHVADSLRLLIKDQDLRYSMGSNGRKKYEEEYRIEIFSQNIINLFEEIDI